MYTVFFENDTVNRVKVIESDSLDGVMKVAYQWHMLSRLPHRVYVIGNDSKNSNFVDLQFVRLG